MVLNKWSVVQPNATEITIDSLAAHGQVYSIT